MATIDIRRSHSMSVDDAKKKAEQLAKDLEGSLGIKWQWDGDKIRFEAPSGAAKGAKGTVSVEASAVAVAIDLPFLLRPMKGMVEGKVNKKLDAMLGGS